MAGRAPNRRDEEEPVDWWGFATIVAIGVGAVVATVAAVGAASDAFRTPSRVEPEPDSDDDERTNQYDFGTRAYSPHSASATDDSKVILAVDATPRRAGAILVLEKTKEIKYYSVDWTNYFDFSNVPSHQEPDKFESANALLALLLWENALKFTSASKRLVKVDNSFADTRKIPAQGVLKEANDRLKRFSGQWEHVSASYDKYMEIANFLSRGNYVHGTAFIRARFPGYTVNDDSLFADLELSNLKPLVPVKFHA